MANQCKDKALTVERVDDRDLQNNARITSPHPYVVLKETFGKADQTTTTLTVSWQSPEAPAEHEHRHVLKCCQTDPRSHCVEWPSLRWERRHTGPVKDESSWNQAVFVSGLWTVAMPRRASRGVWGRARQDGQGRAGPPSTPASSSGRWAERVCWMQSAACMTPCMLFFFASFSPLPKGWKPLAQTHLFGVLLLAVRDARTIPQSSG